MRIENEVAYLDGVLTLPEVGRVQGDIEEILQAGVAVVDLAGVQAVDSSAISLLLSWRRKAESLGQALSFQNHPENLRSLAHLYDVDELIDA